MNKKYHKHPTKKFLRISIFFYQMNSDKMYAMSIELTKSHFSTYVFRISPNIAKGSNRYRPISNWTPKMRAERKTL